MAYNSRLGYDPDKDYSEALSNPTISDAQRAQLTSERQAKINDMYGGTEPTYGNTGKTFSSMYGANGAGATYDYGDNTTLRTNDRVGGITRAANGTPYAQTGASLAGHGLHDYVNDTTDYTTLALQSQSVEELLTRLAERSMKAEAQGLDISGGTPGYRSNEDIAKEWRATIGNNLPSQFVSRSTGQSGVGYYGQDETGDWGYYADPARTQKLDYGNWGDVAPKQALGTAATYIAQNPDALNGVSDVYSQYLNAISGAGGIGLTNYSAPEVDTKWRDIADKLADAYINMNYNDWTGSDQYKALAERYGDQGQMSMQDVLGQIASRTGGLASSYATTAAQQQYNQYMAMLEEVARNSFNEDRNQMYNNAKMALDYYGRDYGEYLDQLAQMNKDRDYNLDLLNQAIAQSNYDREWQNTLDRQRVEDERYASSDAYNRERDALSDQLLADRTAYDRERDALSDQQAAQKTARQIVDSMIDAGTRPSDELIAQSGYPTEYVDAMLVQSAPAYSGGPTYNYVPSPVQEKGDYNSVVADVKTLLSNGASYDDINALLNEAKTRGYITGDQYNSIRSHYRR